MKILSLKSLNINSLKGEVSIDFAKLTQENALFLITGPTGSGKSTLLDIISCALYGRTARVKNPNNLMSKNCAEAYCEVEFEIKGKFYRSSWKQRRARKKYNGAFQSAIMELVDLEENRIFPLRPSEVPKKIEELSGLDFSRFMHSMLLAQGSFASFLKVDEKERSILLEKITGTQIYADISKAIFEKYRLLEQEIANEQKLLDSISILSEDVIAQKEKQLKENRVKKSENEKSIQKLHEALSLSHTLQALQEEDERYKKSLEKVRSSFVLQMQKQEDIQKEIALRTAYLQEHAKEKKLLYRLDIIEEDIKAYKKGSEAIGDGQEDLEVADLRSTFLEKEERYLHFIEYINNDINEEDSLEKNLDEVQRVRESLKKYRSLTTKESELRASIKKSKEERDLLQEISKSAKAHIAEIKNHIETIRQKEQREQLLVKYEEDRKALVEGEACFLCGAREHPFAKEMQTISIDKTKEMLQNRIEELQEREKSLQEVELRLGVMVAKEEGMEEILQKDAKERQEEEKIVKRYISFAIDTHTEEILEAKEKKLRERLQQIKQNRLQKEILLEEKERAFRELQRGEKRDALQNLLKSLQSYFASFGIVLDLKKIEEQYQALLKIQKEYRKNDRLLKELEAELHLCLVAQGESQTQMKLFKKEIASLKKRIERVKEHIKALELLSFNRELEALLRQKADILQESIGGLKKELEVAQENRDRFQKYKVSLEKKKRDFAIWVKLNDLVGSADGTKFKKFAQGVTLDQLIDLANRHLECLSNRYTLARNREKLLELEIVDSYQGNVERPVNTLSGGESFIVSLALALGLSELASQKIAIDSLFLDEGFGTLDKESLEIALNALNLLQTSGKMVGVISHVEVLKERIPLQIKVVPNGDGTSHVEL